MDIRARMCRYKSIIVYITLGLCCVSVSSNPASETRTCNLVESLLVNTNYTEQIPTYPLTDLKLEICESKSSCCPLPIEQHLKSVVKKDFKTLLHHNSKSVEGLLATTARMLEDHVIEMAKQSENKTLNLFHQVYQSMSVFSKEPINTFYYEIIKYIKVDKTSTFEKEITILPNTDYNIENSVLNFFTDLFPLVYHHTVNPRLRDFSNEYKQCLRETMIEIKPFGDLPKELGTKLTKTAESVRILLQSLYLGKQILNSTDQLINEKTHTQCYAALLKMNYCPKCEGVTTKPCAGYCLNVLRGCLTQFSSQLDLPWSGYVQALERLVQGHISSDKSYDTGTIDLHHNLEDVFRSLDSKISEAIMSAMVHGPTIEKKVKRACGAPQWSDDEDQPLPSDRIISTDNFIDPESRHVKVTSHVSHRRKSDRIKESEELLTKQLKHFLSSIAKSRGFYANMAESLCSDESFAETRDTADCWNGQRVGEYTKTVVAASVTAQKYNPEMTWKEDNIDQHVDHLSEQLRHIRQVMLGQLTTQPQSDSFMRDEEGSGSGYPNGNQYIVDDDEDKDWDEGSGSGDSPIDSDRKGNDGYRPSGGPKSTFEETEHKTASASSIHFTTWILFLSLWVIRRFAVG